MDSYEIARLVSATGCGIQLGLFLMLSLMYRPFLEEWPFRIDFYWLFRRFYQSMTLLAVISGVFAILGQARQTGFLLAVLGISYTLAQIHLLKAISSTHQQEGNRIQTHLKRTPKQKLELLKRLQQTLHLGQILTLLYLIYKLGL